MRLENNYYRIESCRNVDGNYVFCITLLSECDVYEGHFPGDPVCPGVCHIGMLKECVMRLVGKRLFVSFIRQCRLTSVATPALCPNVELTVGMSEMDGGYNVTARLADVQHTYMEYKGCMTVSL